VKRAAFCYCLSAALFSGCMFKSGEGVFHHKNLREKTPL